MAILGKLVMILVALATSMGIKTYLATFGPLPAPELNVNEYWGPGTRPGKDDTSVRPFKIEFGEKVIEELRTALSDTSKIRDPLETVSFEYGMNTNYLKTVIKHWRDDYLTKWTSRQTYLNKFPQFKTKIQGLDIHFIHVKGKGDGAGKKVMPLLLLHGWPGSVVEFYSFIEKLQAQTEFQFDIVAPSLPGYGFSEAAAKPGLGATEMSAVFRNLMIRLGYDQFMIQGGDWGALIGSNMASIYPQHVVAFHSNMCAVMNNPKGTMKQIVASFYPKFFMGDHEKVDFVFPVFPRLAEVLEETGYFHLQATKPDTIGTALAHNPIGLAAYILEKFSTWTNPAFKKLPDGGLTKYFTMDSLLDNVMIYYLSNSIMTSQRLYAESMNKRTFAYQMDRVPATVPTACAKFPHDLAHQMDWVLQDKFTNLVQSTYHADGGHFIAMQLPEVLVKDFLSFVKKLNSTPK